MFVTLQEHCNWSDADSVSTTSADNELQNNKYFALCFGVKQIITTIIWFGMLTWHIIERSAWKMKKSESVVAEPYIADRVELKIHFNSIWNYG